LFDKTKKKYCNSFAVEVRIERKPLFNKKPGSMMLTWLLLFVPFYCSPIDKSSTSKINTAFGGMVGDGGRSP